MNQNLPKKEIKLGKFMLGFHSWLIYLFLYLPIIILVLFSFNKSRINSIHELLFTVNPHEYESELANANISDKLKTAFEDKKILLSQSANIIVEKTGSKWQILDKLIFNFGYTLGLLKSLNKNNLTYELKQQFKDNGISLSDNANIIIQKPDNEWLITDKTHFYTLTKEQENINVQTNKDVTYYIKKKRNSLQFSVKSSEFQPDMDNSTIPNGLKIVFKSYNRPLSINASVTVEKIRSIWQINDMGNIYLLKQKGNELRVYEDILQIYAKPGFTFNWYKKLFKNREVFSSTKNSLVIAIISTIVSTIIGTLAAYAMSRYNFPGKRAFDLVLLMPIIIPDIVMGISLLAFYVFIHLTLGIASITIAHIAFDISFVAVVVRARLHGYDKTLDEAAMDLGANPYQTFTKVTLPLIMPGVIGGGLIAFTLSLDDYLITSLVAGPGYTTLPLKVYSMMTKSGVTPEINALSTLILLFTMILILITQRLGISGGKLWNR